MQFVSTDDQLANIFIQIHFILFMKQVCFLFHIEIRHHFIRDHIQKGNIDLQFVSTDEQLTNIFIKPIFEEHFKYLRELLGMILIK